MEFVFSITFNNTLEIGITPDGRLICVERYLDAIVNHIDFGEANNQLFADLHEYLNRCQAYAIGQPNPA